VWAEVSAARRSSVMARGIMLKGVGLEYLWQAHLVLVLMLAVFLALAIRSFKPRLA
jgi:hypothetical protein